MSRVTGQLLNIVGVVLYFHGPPQVGSSVTARRGLVESRSLDDGTDDNASPPTSQVDMADRGRRG